jgi:hypothetical protein
LDAFEYPSLRRCRALPLETTCVKEEGFSSQRQPFAPDTLLILDFIEFVHAAASSICHLRSATV